jgi:hypothetical protein
MTIRGKMQVAALVSALVLAACSGPTGPRPDCSFLEDGNEVVCNGDTQP